MTAPPFSPECQRHGAVEVRPGAGALHRQRHGGGGWIGAHLHILDQKGHATYNDRLSGPHPVRQARRQYVAAVIGDSFSPTLLVKDMGGLAVDSETVAYADKMILDMGFFENGNYLWTTAWTFTAWRR